VEEVRLRAAGKLWFFGQGSFAERAEWGSSVQVIDVLPIDTSHSTSHHHHLPCAMPIPTIASTLVNKSIWQNNKLAALD
jgi:hypothetical protein